jgi:FkbM family methyltransferase
MTPKAFRRLRVLRRCRQMPWFSWPSALPYIVPSWMRPAIARIVLRCHEDSNLTLVRFPNGETIGTPPGCLQPAMAALSQHEFAYYVDLFEARTVLKPGGTVFDAGAGFGAFTLLASKLVGPSGRVVAIEPVPDSLAALNATIKANALSNVTVVGEALDTQVGRVSICLPEGAYSGATGCQALMPKDRPTFRYEVAATTLDALADRLGCGRVDFVKMNIEGMEEAALRGAANILTRDAPALAISVSHLPDDRERLPKVLRELQPRYVTALSTAAGASLEHPVLLAALDGKWGDRNLACGRATTIN